jgi:hypothetical protein
MAAFSLQINLDGQEKLSAMTALLSPATFERALKGGTQYAAKATPPAVAKAVGARYTWRAEDIKGSASKGTKGDIKGPTFSDGGTTATLRLSRRARTAAVFGGRQTARGYSFAIFRGQRETFRRAFLAPGKQGTMLPFYRTGKGRYPIEVIHGPSLGSVFLGDSKYGDVMKKEVETRMAEQFIKGIERELGRKQRGF